MGQRETIQHAHQPVSLSSGFPESPTWAAAFDLNEEEVDRQAHRQTPRKLPSHSSGAFQVHRSEEAKENYSNSWKLFSGGEELSRVQPHKPAVINDL